VQLAANGERALAHVAETVAFGRAGVVEADTVVRDLQDDLGIVEEESQRSALRTRVPSDIAEMVLGHKLTGVRAVYDRHSYAAEKRDALEKLAGLVALILNPPISNVIKLGALK